MKELFQRLFGILPKAGSRGTKFSAFVFSLLAAILLWLVISLSKDYTTEFVIPVSYKNLPEQRILTNNLPREIQLTAKLSGFKLFAKQFKHKRDSLIIDVAEISAASNDVSVSHVVVSTLKVVSAGHDEFAEADNLLLAIPDSLHFDFGERVSKLVSVKSNLHITFERQYDSSGYFSITPSLVEISGSKDVINGIRFVETESVSLQHIKADIRQKLKLTFPSTVFSKTADVELHIPVEKYTEGVLEIPVQVINAKAGLQVKIFPDKVKVRYLVALSKYNKVDAEQFEVVADASGIENLKENRIRVTIKSKPAFIRMAEAEPQKVEFILRRQ